MVSIGKVATDRERVCDGIWVEFHTGWWIQISALSKPEYVQRRDELLRAAGAAAEDRRTEIVKQAFADTIVNRWGKCANGERSHDGRVIENAEDVTGDGVLFPEGKVIECEPKNLLKIFLSERFGSLWKFVQGVAAGDELYREEYAQARAGN